MTTTTKKRGGPQPGSGRPPKDPADTVVKCRISMTQAHHAATEGDRSGMIRRALDWYLHFKDKPNVPDTTTVTVTTSSEVSDPITFTVKGYEDNGSRFIADMERYEAGFSCNECGEFGEDNFAYQRRVANGEIWNCKRCKTEAITLHKPNEDNY